MEDRFTAYFSTALTGVEPPTRHMVEETVAVVREVSAAFGISLYFPGEHTDPVRDPHVSAETVYRIDRQRVKAADLVFVLAGNPSLGVGQELTMAHESLIPTVFLIPDGARVSRMALGVPLAIDKIVYGTRSYLREALIRLLPGMMPRFIDRRSGSIDLDHNYVGARIRMWREELGMSQHRLGAAVGMTTPGVAALEESTDRQSDPSLTQLRRIAAELGVSAKDLV